MRKMPLHQSKHDDNSRPISGAGSSSHVRQAKTMLIHFCFLLLMSIATNFVLDTKNAAAVSLFEPGSIFGPSIVGKWEDADSIMFNAHLNIYSDGTLTIGAIRNGKYTIKDGIITITATNIWGDPMDLGTHKITIEKSNLTLNPPLMGMAHFKRLE